MRWDCSRPTKSPECGAPSKKNSTMLSHMARVGRRPDRRSASIMCTPVSQRLLTVVEALREALREEMRRDERVILLGEDIGVPGGFGGAFTVTLGLEREFGRERVIDTPI